MWKWYIPRYFLQYNLYPNHQKLYFNKFFVNNFLTISYWFLTIFVSWCSFNQQNWINLPIHIFGCLLLLTSCLNYLNNFFIVNKKVESPKWWNSPLLLATWLLCLLLYTLTLLYAQCPDEIYPSHINWYILFFIPLIIIIIIVKLLWLNL